MGIPAPSNPTGINDEEGETWLNVTWTLGVNSTKTRIEYWTANDKSWAPEDHPVGMQKSTAVFFNLTGLGNGQIRFFKLWGFNTSRGYSTGQRVDGAR